MSERMPKAAKGNEMVPSHIFEKEWADSNFTVPINPEIRNELRLQLEQYLHYGIMLQPENQKIRDIMTARVAAIDAYDGEMMKAKIREMAHMLEDPDKS